MNLYYLVANRNGFEEPLRLGTERELLSEQERLEKRETLSSEREKTPTWDIVSYYLVLKSDWDGQHCPLMPVDLS